MNWYKKAQNFTYGQPVRFVNPLTHQESAGVFDNLLDNGKSRVRIGDPSGRPVIIPSEEITMININQQIPPGQLVNLINYPTENPAKIINHKGNGIYVVEPQSKRYLEVSINEITII